MVNDTLKLAKLYDWIYNFITIIPNSMATALLENIDWMFIIMYNFAATC